MLSEERYRKIAEQIESEGSVTVNGLSEKFGVSIETVRRDLIAMEAQGCLKRVFGGAVAERGSVRFEEFPQRMQTHRAQKIAVANKVADLIYEGDTIALDSGTTAMEVAEVLKNRFRKLTIVTYSLKLFNELKDTFDVILTGGEFYAKEEAFYGELATETIGRLHTGKCFIFPSAIGVRYGVEDYVPCFISVQRALMRCSDRIIIAADSFKFCSRGLIRLCDLSPEHIYLTDSDLPEEIAEEFGRNNLNLLIGEL